MTQKEYDPTPEQIAAECRKIRATWSPTVEQRRRRRLVDGTVYGVSIVRLPVEIPIYTREAGRQLRKELTEVSW